MSSLVLTKGNKAGSVTVFICIFFVTLVFMIMTFVNVSKQTAVNSSAGALCGLWGESVLAEYDLNLQKRYNLFGFYGYPSDVRRKLEFYGEESFDDKKYIDFQVTGCSLYDYALVNVDVMKEQLAEAGGLAFTEKFIRPSKTVDAIEGAVQRGGNLFEELPSEGSSKSYSVSRVADFLKSADSVKDAAAEGGKSFLVNQYIFAYFKDAKDDRALGQTYLQQEIEYLICAKKSDAANRSSMRTRIIAVRKAVNFAYLNSDAKKCGAAMAAAQILTPGPAAAATQKAILAAWALAESVNDYRLLMDGHRVADMKTEATWAVDLDTILADAGGDGYIYTGIETGRDYEGYLKLFLYSMDERVKILRIMDLIQINMRYLYYDTFLLREYNAGVSFVMEVNGKEHEVVKTYQSPSSQ